MEIKTEAGRALSKNSFACGWSKHICTYALAAAVNALAARSRVYCGRGTDFVSDWYRFFRGIRLGEGVL